MGEFRHIAVKMRLLRLSPLKGERSGEGAVQLDGSLALVPPHPGPSPSRGERSSTAGPPGSTRAKSVRTESDFAHNLLNLEHFLPENRFPLFGKCSSRLHCSPFFLKERGLGLALVLSLFAALPAAAQIVDSRAEAVMVGPGGASTPLTPAIQPRAAAAPVPLPAHYATAARQVLRAAADQGLSGFDPISAGPDRLADLVIAYARAQHGGRLSPEAFHEAWGMHPAPYDAVQDYNAAVASGRFAGWLASLPPSDPRYEALRQAYVALKAEPPSPERAAQLRRIEANLERWRWAPRDLPAERIEVNIPESRLTLLEDGRPAMGMRAAVGKPAKDMWTPILATEISAVVLNPPWNIPDDIFDNEIAPKLKGDPAAFARRGLVMRPAGEEGTRVYQRHSASSALGQVKLDMPNDYGVYLHDTPGKGVFAKDARSITHGCIRLEGAVPLAKRLLARESAATPEEIARVLAGNDTRPVPLPRREPVYLFYWTAKVENGQLSFAEDIYGWDRELNAKLAAR